MKALSKFASVMTLTTALTSALAAGAQGAGHPAPAYGYYEPAATPAPMYGYAAPAHAEPAHSTGAFEHDGFYLRLGLGLTHVGDSVESESVRVCFSNGCTTGKIESTVGGFGAATEIALGGTVAPGLVIGGGIYNHVIPSPKSDDLKAAGYSVNQDVELETTYFTLYGPFIDFYFDPLGGLHLQGALGLGVLASGKGKFESSGDAVDEHTATGIGAMVGIGHDWWVGEQWSVGVLGRVTVASLTGEDDGDVEWNHTVIAPAILFTATLH
jgi:hypothetical protein